MTKQVHHPTPKPPMGSLRVYVIFYAPGARFDKLNFALSRHIREVPL